MKHLVFLLLIFLSFNNCKSSKRAKSQNTASSKVIIGTDANEDITTNKPIIRRNDIDADLETENTPESKAYGIVEYAQQFLGIRYKFGGATKEGFDCSGLVFECFRAYDIILPRISRDMAKNGEKIALKNVEKGDLLFFKTGNRRNDISHVGLVVSSENGQIEFIHATTSAGVIVSSIAETYWDKTFAEARRIL
jgi:cell wall-associated NlpC family hydrolase